MQNTLRIYFRSNCSERYPTCESSENEACTDRPISTVISLSYSIVLYTSLASATVGRNKPSSSNKSAR
ncbi:hypothetical protein, partial [Burkholderia ubonensis]|uniref:hypothetical protein n=1 Tax=Burkholderia ubonensis TaxID=101571 RepID=UPI001E2D87C4